MKKPPNDRRTRSGFATVQKTPGNPHPQKNNKINQSSGDPTKSGVLCGGLLKMLLFFHFEVCCFF